PTSPPNPRPEAGRGNQSRGPPMQLVLTVLWADPPARRLRFAPGRSATCADFAVVAAACVGAVACGRGPGYSDPTWIIRTGQCGGSGWVGDGCRCLYSRRPAVPDRPRTAGRRLTRGG